MHIADTADMRAAITHSVAAALAEDIGDGDITAALIPATQPARARIISREAGVICGRDWVNEVFHQLDPGVKVSWHVSDGERMAPDRLLFELSGPARSLLTGERTALNFLQLLSGTATRCAHYAQLVDGTGVKLLDTRKTVPGLRLAQKYAVRCGGCHNHRIGLFDAFLVKENHIEACGGIAEAVAAARATAPGKPVEVEVETLEEFEQALVAGSDRIMLDNFRLADLRTAVQRNEGQAELEASGGITEDNLRQTAETGVNYISIGALTKDVVALDLSMRIIED